MKQTCLYADFANFMNSSTYLCKLNILSNNTLIDTKKFYLAQKGFLPSEEKLTKC